MKNLVPQTNKKIWVSLKPWAGSIIIAALFIPLFLKEEIQAHINLNI